MCEGFASLSPVPRVRAADGRRAESSPETTGGYLLAIRDCRGATPVTWFWTWRVVVELRVTGRI